jgi:hypothetical protein
MTATDQKKSKEEEGKLVDNEEIVIFGDEPSEPSDFRCQVLFANEGDDRIKKKNSYSNSRRDFVF